MDALPPNPRPMPRPMPLDGLAARLGLDAPDTTGIAVTGVTLDSRSVRPGDLFVGLPGANVHGARFAPQAIAAGAVAVLTDSSGRSHVPAGVVCVVTEHPRQRVGDVAAEVYGRPADQLLMLGVTGTNGKTTTTYLLDAGLRAAGHRTGVVGTVGTVIDGVGFPTSKTTPEATELHALLAVMRERGVSAVAMEVSSHALAMGRVDGCVFDVAGFTQLGLDHLDFHGSAKAYMAAKELLFQPAHSREAVVVVDDEGGRHVASSAGVPVTTLGEGARTDWHIEQVRARPLGGHLFHLRGPGQVDRACEVALIGRFNVTNAALAQVMLERAGIDPAAAAGGISGCRGVPGRMELVGPGDPALVVDYAHTTAALEAAIAAVRPAGGGRVIVVVGCGGDRDRTKRAPMGAAAARLADVVVVTDDNPRSEPASEIRRAVVAGANSVPAGERAEVVDIGDRSAAIEAAVRRARLGDVVLVAGKGHETGQEVNGVVTPFDDRVELAVAWDRVHPQLESS